MKRYSPLLLLVGLVATVALPTAVWQTRPGGESPHETRAQLLARSSAPSTAVHDGEPALRVKRSTAALSEVLTQAPYVTTFNNTHLYQAHINLTINNVFGKTVPDAGALAAVVQSVNMFQNLHLHQPRMNITLNNCF